MNHHDDHLFDERLREVPVPAGLAARVDRAALFDDAAIDRLLVRVDVPAGLDSRMRHALAVETDGGADGMSKPLRVALPAGPVVRPAGPRSWSVGRMLGWLASGDLLADSAAVAAALSIVALMFFAGTEFSRRLAAPADGRQREAVHAGGGPRVASVTAAAPAPAPVMRRDAPQSPAAPAGDSATAGDTSIAGGAAPRPTAGAVASGGGPAREVGSGVVIEPVEPPVEVRAAPAAVPALEAARGGADGIRTVLLPRAGRRVPRVPGFDIAFEMAHGESPFVDPALAAALATDHPPLSLRTDSFDTLCAAVRRDGGRSRGKRTNRGGMPAVRVEEILAALPVAAETDGPDGGVEPGIGLSIHAVRSLRSPPGSLLVEVCATAPPLAVGGVEPGADKPLDAMVLLDQSGGPFANISWQWLCRGLARLVSQMRSADRLSVIVCGERPRLVALRADATHLAGLLPELAAESVAKSADFDAAFRLVAAVGRREGRPARVVAVAHAVSLEQAREEGRAARSAWQADRAGGAAAATVEFVVVDPQEPLQAAGGDRGPAEAATGRIAADPLAIGRAMAARVFARPTLVATGCRLEVAFDPARVGAYRIVGHRQTAAEALAADRPRPIDLHVGESVRVVYEVMRRPGGAAVSDAGLVSATLAWTPAAFDGASGGGRNDSGGSDGEQRVRAVWTDGTAAGPGASRAVAPDLAAGLPSRHGCELLLAVALGELMGPSVHADPWRQKAAGIAALAARWQARGDVTQQGRLLIDCLEYHGVFSEPAGR